MAFLTEPAYRHDSAPAIGVLLVNLGTPQAPTPAAVRTYLREFLTDPRVVELPRLPWRALLEGVILPLRSRSSAKKYAKIWTPEGSPLAFHTQRQARLLQGYLGEKVAAPVRVEYAMRYGRPAVAEALGRLRQAGCDKILVLPLYPQYASSSSGTVFDAVGRAVQNLRNVPELRVVKQFPAHPGYIAALASSVREYWRSNGRGELLVTSFHGLPRVSLDRGDPYHCECHRTARLLAEALELPRDRLLVTFQSRFGRARWLEPYTLETMTKLPGKGVRRVDVCCPGFVSDCLETLEEIALENKAAFLQAGGAEFHYIACLNERDDWIRALRDLAVEHMAGWIGADYDAAAAKSDGVQRLARARVLGATN